MRILLVVAAMAAVLLAAGPAQAGTPSYHSPGYKGTKKAPPTGAADEAAPKPVAVGNGSTPDVLVDAAGTAHAAWNDAQDPKVVHYCRLPRGADGCDATYQASLPDTPAGPPFVLAFGDALVILSQRAGAGRPVFALVSFDGGRGFSGDPTKVGGPPDINGSEDLRDAVTFGTQGAERIALIFDGAKIQIVKPGSGPSQFMDLTPKDNGFQGTPAALAATPDGGLTAAFDVSNNVAVRTWNRTGDVLNESSWSPAATVPGYQPALATGPSGSFLQVLNESRLTVHGVSGGGQPGKGTIVSPPNATIGAISLFEDGNGDVRSTWVTGLRDRLAQRVLDGGKDLGKVRTLYEDSKATYTWLSGATAPSDGGGFLALARAPSQAAVGGPGTILLAGFGSQKGTGKLGLGGQAGIAPDPGDDPGATAACSHAAFGAVTIRPGGGCLLGSTDPDRRNVLVSEGEVDLNGLKIVPDAGVKILIDAKKHTLDTTGTVRVLLASGSTEILLWHGDFHVKLPAAGAGTTLFSFDTSDFGVDVLGFGVKGRVDVILTSDGVRIPISIALPPAFGDIRGDAVLLGKKGSGLELDTLKIHAGGIFLGPLVLKTLDITSEGGGRTWTGKADVQLPPPGVGGSLKADVIFIDGSYKSGSFLYTFPKPGIVLGPAIYLQAIQGLFALDPTKIQAGAQIGAGPPALTPITALGTFTMVFPKQGPSSFRLDGTVSLFLFQLGKAFVEFQTDGYAAFGGEVALDLGPVHAGGKVEGTVDGPTGHFGAGLDGDVCINLKIESFDAGCVGLGISTGISDYGFAACVNVSVPPPVSVITGSEITAGLELPWKDVPVSAFFNPIEAIGVLFSHLEIPCSTADYKVPQRGPVSRALRQAGGTAVQLEAGAPTQTLLVKGDTAAPDVSVTGPDGQPAGYRVTAKGIPATYVVLTKPAAGTYAITPAQDSAPITDVMVSEGYTPASATAKVRGRGLKRALRYRVRNATHGQRVAFVEKGAFGEHRLGTAKGARGTLRFRPHQGGGKRRTVVAVVERAGIPLKRTDVARFTGPPAPRAGRARRVRVRRTGSTVVVSWRGRSPQWAVKLRGSHGRRTGLLLPGKAHTAVVRGLAPGDRISAAVSGRSATGRPGRAARGKQPKPRRKHRRRRH